MPFTSSHNKSNDNSADDESCTDYQRTGHNQVSCQDWFRCNLMHQREKDSFMATLEFRSPVAVVAVRTGSDAADPDKRHMYQHTVHLYQIKQKAFQNTVKTEKIC